MYLSVIIVNYNTKELLKQTIQSVIDTIDESIKYEIIVSDNGSKDGSCDMIKLFYPMVRLIENKANLGFSKGNNIAINNCIGKYILLLNSDTLVQGNCIEKCIAYMENNTEAGALGCKILLENGTLDHACKRGFPTPESSLYYMLKLDKIFPLNKKFGAYTLDYLSQDEINEVDSLTGAFMLLRREVIEKVGLLDEDFFMYGEDIDWCYRIKEAGYKVVYYPKGSIIHYKGCSSKKKRLMTIYEFHRAMYLFYNKHYLKKYNILVAIMVYIGISLKLILSLLTNIFRKMR